MEMLTCFLMLEIVCIIYLYVNEYEKNKKQEGISHFAEKKKFREEMRQKGYFI